jgi:hypothetical protein
VISFWKWFLRGAGGTKAGWRLMITPWLLLHASVGCAMYYLMPVSPYDFAAKALFPAASILVGMAVAWTSRAAAVLQDQQFKEAVITDERPIEAYVYGYQLSLLIIMIMVVYISITANGGIQTPLKGGTAAAVTGVIMYALLSIAMRECWTVINFSNLLSILHNKVPSSNPGSAEVLNNAATPDDQLTPPR